MNKLFCALALTILTSGCSGKQKNETVSVTGVKVPEWVVNPKPGCAAGAYKMKGNISMAMDMSTHHARHQLSQQLQVVTKSLIRKYVEEGEHDSENFTEDLSLSVTQSVTNITMNGSIPVKQDVSGDHYFTLVCLDPEVFSNSFTEMNQLDEKVRYQLRDRAKIAFEDLESLTD